MANNPYAILGLNNDASIEDVKKARNELIKKYHPDHNPGYADEANEKMKEINAAYEQIMSGFDLEKCENESTNNDANASVKEDKEVRRGSRRTSCNRRCSCRTCQEGDPRQDRRGCWERCAAGSGADRPDCHRSESEEGRSTRRRNHCCGRNCGSYHSC